MQKEVPSTFHNNFTAFWKKTETTAPLWSRLSAVSLRVGNHQVKKNLSTHSFKCVAPYSAWLNSLERKSHNCSLPVLQPVVFYCHSEPYIKRFFQDKKSSWASDVALGIRKGMRGLAETVYDDMFGSNIPVFHFWFRWLLPELLWIFICLFIYYEFYFTYIIVFFSGVYISLSHLIFYWKED